MKESDRAARAAAVFSDEDGVLDFKPLTSQEAQSWRSRNPVTSPWRVLSLQAFVGLAMVVFTASISGQLNLAASVAWGVLSVWVPALVFARAMFRQSLQTQAASALIGFFVWELVKVVLTVAFLMVAPRVVADLSWLALVVGFVVTIKMYGLVMVLNKWQQHQPLKF